MKTDFFSDSISRDCEAPLQGLHFSGLVAIFVLFLLMLGLQCCHFQFFSFKCGVSLL